MDGLDIQTRSVGSDRTITHECLILDTFYVDVNHLTIGDLEDLGEQCLVTRASRIGRQKEFDQNLWIERAPDFYLAGTGRGLTPKILAKLGIILNTDPVVDDMGNVPVTAKVLGQLWRYANPPAGFRDRITEFSQELVGFLAAASAAKKNGSGNSSVP